MTNGKTTLLLHAGADITDKDEWLRIKANHISGTDAGSIMGVNPWKSDFSLYWSKINQGKDIKTDAEEEEKEVIHWGKVLEEAVAKEFTLQTGLQVVKRGTLQDNYCPYRIANIDRKIRGKNAGLECKTTSFMNRKEWEGNKIPKHYYYQCLHYMLVLFCDMDGTLLDKYKDACWYIACLIGGQKFVWKQIPFNQNHAWLLAKKEKEFFDRLKNGNSPTPTPMKCDEYTITREKAAKDFTFLNSDAEENINKYMELQQQIKTLETMKQLCKNEVLNYMMDFQKGSSQHFDVSLSNPNPRESISITKLKKDPELYELVKKRGMISTITPTRVLRIKEKDFSEW